MLTVRQIISTEEFIFTNHYYPVGKLHPLYYFMDTSQGCLEEAPNQTIINSKFMITCKNLQDFRNKFPEHFL
jgi:hypothetical protein